MPKLQVVLASTREQRAGAAVAEWFLPKAKEHGKFEVELIDLKVVNLPLFDEPVHPVKHEYQHEHTKAWSKSVASADAFVFVIPEYNHAMPPALLNALDYLVTEWAYKPAAFVSYGGASGGMRAAASAKGVLTTLKMMPIPEAVALPFFMKAIDENGTFDPGDTQNGAVKAMLDELARWTGALKTLRG